MARGRGSQLVVLSACDSGVGQPLTGGLGLGLRNALQLVGAALREAKLAIILSPWKAAIR